MTDNATEEIDTLQKYGTAFQSKAIRALIDDKNFLERTHDIIDPEYWESEANKWIVAEILDYFGIYKKPLTLDVFRIKVDELGIEVLKAAIIDQLKNIFT